MCKSCIAKLRGGMKKKSRKTTRRRRARIGNISGGGVMTVVKSAAMAGAGFIAGQALVSKVEFLKNNPGIAAGVKLAGAVLLPTLLKNQTGAQLAAGMAVGAVVDVVKMAAPEMAANTLGLGFPAQYYGSALIPGVAGIGGATVTVD